MDIEHNFRMTLLSLKNPLVAQNFNWFGYGHLKMQNLKMTVLSLINKAEFAYNFEMTVMSLI